MTHGFLKDVLMRKAGAPASLPTLAEIGLNAFVPYLLNRAAAQWNAGLAEALASFDLTTPQVRVLAVLTINSGLTVNELAVLTVTEQSTMSRTLDGLEEQGLIRRTARHNDLRMRDIALTGLGRERFDTLWPIMFERYTAMFEGVSNTEYQALAAVLHKIIGNTSTNREAS